MAAAMVIGGNPSNRVSATNMRLYEIYVYYPVYISLTVGFFVQPSRYSLYNP